MKHVRISPLSAPDRRKPEASPKDRRWRLLDLVRQCRTDLGLRDRDVAVLRGLVSLLPDGATELTVYAGNRVLIERCDGIEERTLRRRIAHLVSCGLIGRRQSPNGKRYQIREDATEVLTYGLDLTPLFGLEAHLTALAEAGAREALRARSLRALIRDWLYHHAQPGVPLHEAARRALRRKLDCSALAEILNGLGARPNLVPAPELSASDSQTVRHIQRSDKEDIDIDCASTSKPAQDISLDECLELSRSARSLSPAPLQTWADIAELSSVLAPAIGVGRATFAKAQDGLGRQGCALAVFGLLEAFDRIKNPEAYLAALTRRAKDQGLDIVRMFRSLVRPRLGLAL